MPAANLILEELRSWPGVESVRLEASTGEASILASDQRPYIGDMLEAVLELDYAIADVRRRPV